MAFEITIKVDPSQAKGAIADVGTALGKAEAAGTSAGAATSKAFAGASSSVDRAAASVKQLDDMLKGVGNSSGLDALTSSLTRQQAVWERLTAPMHAYQAALQGVDADVDALDQLLGKGRISWSQYTDEVTRLNAELAKVKPGAQAAGPRLSAAPSMPAMGVGGGGGDMFGAIAGQAGGAGAMLAQFAQGGTAAVGAMALLGHELVNVGDDYIELTNRVQQFATSQHSADAIISDQLSLAGDMHTSLAATTELYARVRQGTDDLGLSYSRSIDFTKALGESVQLSGKGMDVASGIMQKLGYAMDAGTISGRELKSIMREVPTLADTWSEAFGKGPAQLVKMADQGKLSVSELELAVEHSASTIGGQFAQRTETAAEAWQHFKDTATVTLGKVVEGSDLIPNLTKTINDLSGAMRDLGPAMGGVGDGLKAVSELASMDAQRLKFLSDAFTLATGSGENMAAAFTKSMDAKNAEKADEFASNLMKIDAAANGIVDRFRALESAGVDKIFDGMVSGATNATNKITALRGALTQITTTQMSMVNSGGANGYNGMSGWAAYDQLQKDSDDQRLRVSRQLEDAQLDLGKATSSYGATVEEVHAKTLQHTRALEDLHNALGAGAITMAEYNTAMKGLSTGESAEQKLLESILAPQQTYNTNLAAADALFQRGAISAGQYWTELEKLSKSKPADVPDLHSVDLPGSYGGAKGFSMPGQSLAARSAPLTLSATDLAADKASMAAGAAPMNDAMAASTAEAKKFAEQLKAFESPGEKYTQQLAEIDKAQSAGAISASQAAMFTGQLQEKYAVGQSDAEKLATAQRNLNDLFGRGAIDFQHYQVAMAEAQAAMDHSFGQGVINGLHAIKASTLDTASTMKSAMTSAFANVNQAIADLVVDGKADWSKLVNSIEKDAVKITLQFIEGAIAQDLGIVAAMTTGGVAAGSEVAAGVALGGVGAAAELAAATTFGAAEFATAIMAAGSFAAAQMAAAVGNLPAAAVFGGLGLFGFASGGSFEVGGSGGTDTTPVAFMATPGERVTVQTPAQQRAASSGGGGAAPVVNVKVIHVHDHQEATLEVMRSQPGERTIVSSVAKNRKRLGG